MAQDTADFLASVVREPAHLVGWSDVGIVGVLVAIARPNLVRKLVVIGSNIRPAKQVTPGADEMLKSMTVDSPEAAMLRGLYEAASPDGPGHWSTILDKR